MGLTAGAIVLLVALGSLAGAGISDWGWVAQLALGLSGATAIATIIALVAIVKNERSILLLAPLLFGAFWVMFVLGEFLSPH